MARTSGAAKVEARFSTLGEAISKAAQHFGGNERGSEQGYQREPNIETQHPQMKRMFFGGMLD